MILRNCGGLLLLALGAVAASIEKSEGKSELLDGEAFKIDAMEPVFFFISKLTGLWQVIETETGTLKAERRAGKFGDKAIAVDYHYEKNLLFWSTYDGKIYRSSMRGRYVPESMVELIYEWSDWYPVSIAVDYVNDLLYIIDSNINSLSVMNLNGSASVILLTRRLDSLAGKEFRPRYMEIDPFEGLIFFMDQNNNFNHMYQMNTDGTNIQPVKIASVDKFYRAGSFTLDQKNLRILVSSPSDSAMISANYAKSDDEPRKVIDVMNYASSMTIGKNNSYLYFVNITAYSKYMIEDKVTDIMKTDLFRCEYSSETQSCKEGWAQHIELNGADEWMAMLQLKAVGESLRRLENNNPCDKNVCEDICIYNARLDDHTCKCKTGFGLSDDVCKAFDDFLILENDNYVAGLDISLRKNDVPKPDGKIIRPLKIDIKSVGEDQNGFDYDPLKRRLLYSSGNEVIVKYVDDGTKFSVLVDSKDSYGLLAMDSTANQLYFVKIYTDLPRTYSIGVVNIRSKFSYTNDKNEVTQRFPKKTLLFDVGQVRSLAVYPALGYVFYVSFDEDRKKFTLTRMNVDGSGVTNLYEKLGVVNYMALDYEEEQIYYIDDKRWIYRADFNGENVAKFIQISDEEDSLLGCINGFSVYEDWIFVKSRNTIRLTNKQLLCPRWIPFNIRSSHINMQTPLRFHSTKTNATNIQNPCSKKRCQQICFALPDGDGKLEAECNCDDNYNIHSDGTTCKLEQFETEDD